MIESNRYFSIIFFIIETTLFISLFLKLFLIKILKKKSLSSAGIFFVYSMFFFFAFGICGAYPIIIGDYLGVSAPLKSFIFIIGLIYLQIYFCKMAKQVDAKNSMIKVKENINKQEKIQSYMYTFSSIMFLIETLCIPVFCNSKCYIRLYEIIPALCLLLSFIYQIKLYKQIVNKKVIYSWLLYTFFIFIFLIIRFIIENFILHDFTLINIIGVFFRTCQLFVLGYIAFLKKDDLEVCLI